MAVKKIVRLLATDMNGELSVERALRNVKGIGVMFSKAITNVSGIDPDKKIGSLDDGELKKLEECIKAAEVPKWMLNRRKDRETGEDMHIVGASIDLKKREDINLLKRIRAYRGIRHELGQPVRGQRTRSTFRTQKTVGVSKKAARQQQAKKKQ